MCYKRGLCTLTAAAAFSDRPTRRPMVARRVRAGRWDRRGSYKGRAMSVTSFLFWWAVLSVPVGVIAGSFIAEATHGR